MHNALCQVCGGSQLLITMRAGMAMRRNTGRVISKPLLIRCTGCRGARMFPVPGRTLAGRRLPAI